MARTSKTPLMAREICRSGCSYLVEDSLDLATCEAPRRSASSTWFGPPTDPSDSAGGQYQLCLPSRGANIFPMDNWSGACGMDPGAGFGTPRQHHLGVPGHDPAHALHDRQLVDHEHERERTAVVLPGRHVGHRGPGLTSHNAQLDAGTSELQELSWTVPAVRNLQAYRPIVRIVAAHVDSNGNSSASSVRSDWIPLSGTVSCQPIAITP